MRAKGAGRNLNDLSRGVRLAVRETHRLSEPSIDY
jgi:hypothetical protein